MNHEDNIPILVGHLGERDVTEDTSIVDDDVDASKGVDGCLDNPITEFDTVVVGDGLGVHNGGNCHFICF